MALISSCGDCGRVVGWVVWFITGFPIRLLEHLLFTFQTQFVYDLLRVDAVLFLSSALMGLFWAYLLLWINNAYPDERTGVCSFYTFIQCYLLGSLLLFKVIYWTSKDFRPVLRPEIKIVSIGATGYCGAFLGFCYALQIVTMQPIQENGGATLTYDWCTPTPRISFGVYALICLCFGVVGGLVKLRTLSETFLTQQQQQQPRLLHRDFADDEESALDAATIHEAPRTPRGNVVNSSITTSSSHHQQQHHTQYEL